MVAESRHNVLLSVKEAITNAVRHGQPTEILLQLTLQNGGIEILIKDNGVGFDPARHPPGNGLANLQERMHKINGQCRIQSSPGQGTMVFLAIPL
jgi:signal transduction histidine kinase